MTSKPELKIYIAGKVSKDSQFGTHHWRDEFCRELEELSDIKLANLDPLTSELPNQTPEAIFAKDCQLISEADVFVVYLSDDISVGGSQEILIARYLRKPVIGLAPKGGKFNEARREMLGTVIDDYRDPFVFMTCDVVCGTIEEVATALKTIDTIETRGLAIIDDALSL
jgi:nucleoside 2-deoxyribosyltransferase